MHPLFTLKSSLPFRQKLTVSIPRLLFNYSTTTADISSSSPAKECTTEGLFYSHQFSQRLIDQGLCSADQSQFMTHQFYRLLNLNLQRMNQNYQPLVDMPPGLSLESRAHELFSLQQEAERLQNDEFIKWRSWNESLARELASQEHKCDTQLAQTVHDAILELAQEKVHFKEGHLSQTMAVQDLFTQIDTETQNMQGNIDKLMSSMFFSTTSALGMTAGFIVTYMRLMGK